MLAIAPDLIEGGVNEPLLEDTYPSDIRIIRVRGISPRLTRAIGIGSVWLRCGASVRAAGDKLLREVKFDLVFFSTTQFDFFTLGLRWKTMFGVPYILDYQDPWVNDYYSRTHTVPPGGQLKFAFSQWTARRREPVALRGASGVVAVSNAYEKTLAESYPWFDQESFKVIPFGAAAQDFEVAQEHRPKEVLVDFEDGLSHHVYTGRCGPDMSTSLTIIFRAFKSFLKAQPDAARRIRFHFIGTDYAPRPFGKDWAMPVALAEGVEEYVTEHCYRVPYFDALYYLIHADALVAVGSNDPTYSASKIFPYVLAKRPMILIFNKESPVMDIARDLKCGLQYGFRNADDIIPLSEQVAADWFQGGKMAQYLGSDRTAFLPYTAEGMTRQLADRFVAALEDFHATP